MILSFKDKETHKIFNQQISKKLPMDIHKRAMQKLRILNGVSALVELTIPPSNNLESLKGDRLGQYSIRINNQWRICFKWENNNAIDGEIVDYH